MGGFEPDGLSSALEWEPPGDLCSREGARDRLSGPRAGAEQRVCERGCSRPAIASREGPQADARLARRHLSDGHVTDELPLVEARLSQTITYYFYHKLGIALDNLA